MNLVILVVYVLNVFKDMFYKMAHVIKHVNKALSVEIVNLASMKVYVCLVWVDIRWKMENVLLT